MKRLSLLYSYLLYRIKSTNEHGVHSPFVFDLVTNVIYTDKDYYPYAVIEKYREQWLNTASLKPLLTKEIGAKYSKLLFRLVNKFQPATIIEVGGNVGIETAYIGKANSYSKIFSLEENDKAFVNLKSTIKRFELKNVTLINEPIKVGLTQAISSLAQVDLAYIKNKNAEEVMWCFNKCLEKSTVDSVFIFSDIYSSKEMKAAWANIKNHHQVTVTVDLFYFGIVFFRTEQVKQHFLIRF